MGEWTHESENQFFFGVLLQGIRNQAKTLVIAFLVICAIQGNSFALFDPP
jgi:hypothetical protein